MTTNKDKLVNWDADFYKSLEDTFCLYCLSKKQVYVLGQALQQIHWSTRWFGDTSGLDFSEIAGELEGILGMSECGEYGNLFNLINDLQTQIVSLQATVENGGIPPQEATDTIETPLYNNQSTNLQAPVGNLIVPCDTTEERDKLYAACAELAEFIVQQMTDFLEEFRVQASRLPELIQGTVEAVPLLETLPADELAGAVGYFADEATDLWYSTVTEDRIQDFRCLLFCAAIANDCKLTPDLVLDVLAAQAPTTLQDFYIYSIRDIIGILILGHPVGDEFFYSQLYVELSVVLLGERWLSAEGWRPYEYRFLSGYNSPDNDWSIFCTECPDWGYYEDWRFWTDDIEQWDIITGSYNGEFIEGEITNISGSHNRSTLVAEITLPEDANVKGVGIEFGGDHDCSTGGMSINVYEGATSIGGFGINPTIATTKQQRTWGTSLTTTYYTGNKIRVTIVSDLCNGNPPKAYLYGVRAWYHSTSLHKGHLTLTLPTTVANGDTSGAFWKSWKETP